jgi:hypothetical protein
MNPSLGAAGAAAAERRAVNGRPSLIRLPGTAGVTIVYLDIPQQPT